MAPRTDLTKLTVRELKAECRSRGLLVGGAKAVLVQRLLDDNSPWQGPGSEEAPATGKKKKKKNEADDHKEPKTKWKNSEAKRLLEKDILNGKVPLYAKDENGKSTMALQDIYTSRPEFSEYLYDKFSSRLSSLRKSLQDKKDRAAWDQEAFEIFKGKHPVLARFSRHGYIQWQGSDAQRLLLKDIEDGKHKTQSRKDLYGSKPEYYNEFPLDVFRDKLNQEIRTAKYLYTLEVRGKDPRKKKK